MREVGTRAWRRPASAEDEGLVYTVFSSTWQDAVAAMPNPALGQHFLRIQYTAQERRFRTRYPDLERYVVMIGDERAGRLYLHRSPSALHVVDLSLLPAHRGRGIGRALTAELMAEATEQGVPIRMRLGRTHDAIRRAMREGFRVVAEDDVETHLEWTPPSRT